jgi:DNA-binding Lrp family transcriptional regulator
MRELDETDREIVRLLLEDARRPYADIADHVDLSPPAVSDRVERLRDLGVIRRFTLDLDRSRLRDGVDVLVSLSVEPGAAGEVRAALADLEGVEHVFETADARVVISATAPDSDVGSYLAGAIDMSLVRSLEVDLVADSDWQPHLGEATLGLTCAECDNTVTSEGVTSTLDGTRYEFCCTSCQSAFEDRFERLQEGAES